MAAMCMVLVENSQLVKLEGKMARHSRRGGAGEKVNQGKTESLGISGS